jgi:hypothetical protein
VKKLIAAAMAVAFAVTVGIAWAATETCTVESVDGETVTLKCEEGKLKLEAGDEVKVQKKTEKFEGC